MTPDESFTAQPDSTPERPVRRRDRQQSISSMQIVFVLILSFGLLLVINFSGRIARGQQMEGERVRLQATIDVLQTQKIDLLKQRDYAAHDAAVENWAHTEGKMARDGEILVIPIPGENAGVFAPTATPPALIIAPDAEPQTPSWRLWWNLFFDGPPPF